MRNQLFQKILRIIGLIGFSISVIVITFEIFKGVIQQPKEDENLEKLKIEFSKINILQSSSVVTKHNISYIGKTSVEEIYNSPSLDREIKDYYNGELKKNKWQLSKVEKIYDWGRDLGGEIMIYNKPNFELTIQYSGDRNGYGWAYSIYLKLH